MRIHWVSSVPLRSTPMALRKLLRSGAGENLPQPWGEMHMHMAFLGEIQGEGLGFIKLVSKSLQTLAITLLLET